LLEYSPRVAASSRLSTLLCTAAVVAALGLLIAQGRARDSRRAFGVQRRVRRRDLASVPARYEVVSDLVAVAVATSRPNERHALLAKREPHRQPVSDGAVALP
jgi:hypothetical protein